MQKKKECSINLPSILSVSTVFCCQHTRRKGKGKGIASLPIKRRVGITRGEAVEVVLRRWGDLGEGDISSVLLLIGYNGCRE